MTVKTAAQLAKQHIAELFTDEGAQNIGLEEIEFDGGSGEWRVTVGFTRPWGRGEEPIPSAAELFSGQRRRARDMKVVVLHDQTGQPLAVKNRE